MTIKQELTKGVFWIALAKYSGIFISLGITAILARHISPAAFGTMAIATVIMVFLDIFTDLGIGAAIIQFKDLTKRQLNSLFMVGCCIGFVLAACMFFSSEPIAHYYNDNQLTTVCHWLSVSLWFNALNIVPNGLMLKNKRFKVVALRTLTFQIISGSIAIWGALHGWGIYALIVNPVTTSIGVFIVNFYNYPQKIILDIDFDAVRRVWKYSSFQFLFNIVNYFSRNIDKLIIGKYFSMSDLGYYDKSYRLMQLPLSNITFVITPVLHPILSYLQDDKEQLAQKNTKLVQLLCQISFPLGIILFFCAGDIIEIIFGSDWRPSIPIFKILAISVPLQVVSSTCGSIFLASGNSNHMFYTGLLNTLITVSGFIFAAMNFNSIESIAWAWDMTLAINCINTYAIMYKYSFNTSIRPLLLSFTPQIINTSVVTVLVIALTHIIRLENSIIHLMSFSSISVALTLILAYILKQYNIINIAKGYFHL